MRTPKLSAETWGTSSLQVVGTLVQKVPPDGPKQKGPSPCSGTEKQDLAHNKGGPVSVSQGGKAMGVDGEPAGDQKAGFQGQ